MDKKEEITSEIEGFIFYAFSDDKERQQFIKCRDDYMNEVWEEDPYSTKEELTMTLPKEMPTTRKEVWDILRKGNLLVWERKTLINLFNVLES